MKTELEKIIEGALSKGTPENDLHRVVSDEVRTFAPMMHVRKKTVMETLALMKAMGMVRTWKS